VAAFAPSGVSGVDYLLFKADGAFSVRLGAADDVPVNNIFVKDGPLKAGVTQIVITNLSSTAAINLTYDILAH
jgi:hypothetical protein